MQPERARVAVVIHLRLLPAVVVVVNAVAAVVAVVAACVVHASVLLVSQLLFLLRFALVTCEGHCSR